jgi:hypothetical protein
MLRSLVICIVRLVIQLDDVRVYAYAANDMRANNHVSAFDLSCCFEMHGFIFGQRSNVQQYWQPAGMSITYSL